MTRIDDDHTWPAPDPRTEGISQAKSGYTRLRDDILSGGDADGDHVDAPVGGVRALAGMGVIAGLLVLLGLYSTWSLLFVVLLLVCVFLHELGHFVTARLTGMKATQFFLFMGPRLWSFRRGETEYGVRAYPLGAFVRIIGMSSMDEVPPEDEHRAYRNKSFPRRMLVITAGSLMHMLIAIALLLGVYATKGELQPGERLIAYELQDGGPAHAAGVRADDEIVSLDGLPMDSARQLATTVQAMAPGTPVEVVVLREGAEQRFTVVLGSNPNEGPAFGKGYFGASSGQAAEWTGMSVGEAARRSVTDLGSAAWSSVGGVITVLNPVNIYDQVFGESPDPSKQPSTVVGITGFSDTIASETGFGGLLLLLAGINVFVGLLNLFPILPFDGGHAAIAIYERIRSRKGKPYHADVSKMIPVAMTMVGVLLVLMVAGLYLDFARPPR